LTTVADVVLACSIVLGFFLLLAAGYATKKLSEWRTWKEIEALCGHLGINRKTAYIDSRGYPRWKRSGVLCHRDIAYHEIYRKHYDKYPRRFSEYDVHHVNGNKFDARPENLEVLTREEHEERHGTRIVVDGVSYRKVCRVKRVYASRRAWLVGDVWLPKSQCFVKDGWIYAPVWLLKEKGL